MNSECQERVRSQSEKATQFLKDCRIAFGHSPLVDEIGQATQEAIKKWEDIAGGKRGISIPTIAFVGPFNAGKSWLCRMLLQDETQAASTFRAGTGLKTELLHWVGPQRPEFLEPVSETYTRLDPQNMVDLGTPYQILDTPGSGDNDPALQESAERALRLAQVKILVTREERLRAEEYRQYLGVGNGSLVLPVVNFCNSVEENLNKLDLCNRLREAAPQATILDPLYFQDSEKAANAGEVERQIRKRLIERLTSLMHEEADKIYNATGIQLGVAFEDFHSQCKEILGCKLQPLREAEMELKEAERNLPQAALDFLLEDSSQVRALLRGRFRALFIEGIPAFAFPYRLFAGLLTLTAGAWDRLIFGVSGSLPSLLSTGYVALKGARDIADASSRLRDRVKIVLTQLVRSRLRSPLLGFHGALQRATTQVVGKNNDAEIHFDITGVDELAASWNREVANVTEACRPNRKASFFAALLAMVVFWLLFSAPLLHIYGEYVSAAIHSWQGHWTKVAIEQYPTFDAKFWFIAFVLSAAPVFLIALVMATVAFKSGRIKKAQDSLQESMMEKLQEGILNFSLIVKDSRLEALRRILRTLDI